MKLHILMCAVALIVLSGCGQTKSARLASQPLAENPGFRGALTVTGQQIQYPQTESPEIIARISDFAPGQETGWHKHPVPTYTQVIEGTLTIDFEDGNSVEFPAGSGLLDVLNTWHNGRNAGDVPLKAVIVILGEKGKQNLIRRSTQ
ncbi:MAG TPA: cupin domain-containing protein [Nitrospirales bacterium]|jgi:quercetin dioxygenase-like cupin family protein|nr:cupin domain-containing protein [Nitrospirales bacterium]HIN33486.1 cupin domain-containing protein [Nitrospirales bacterium]